MARFPQCVAEKGSQKWVQRLVNEMSDLLDSQMREKLNLPEEEYIRWLSPLKDDDFAEYRDQAFVDLLGVELKKIPLAGFWPEGGPQWDALGKSCRGKLFLVEAKSHVSEMFSTLKAKYDASKRIIYGSLEKTRSFLNSNSQTDWARGYYQYANRLAHLYLLRRNELPACLVFVYFINDSEIKGPTTMDEWKVAIGQMHSYLGIQKHRLQGLTADIFIDVRQLARAGEKRG